MVARCLPLGPQYATDADSTGGGMMKIAQTPALILILNPDLTYRQILPGRPPTRNLAESELDGILGGALGGGHAGGGKFRIQ